MTLIVTVGPFNRPPRPFGMPWTEHPVDATHLLAKAQASPPEAVCWLAYQRPSDPLARNATNTLFSVLFDFPLVGEARCAPCDLANLRACRLMIEQIPGARGRLARLADIRANAYVRTVLLNLARNWNAICDTMDRLDPDWRIASRKRPEAWAAIEPLLYQGADLGAPRHELVGSDRLAESASEQQAAA